MTLRESVLRELIARFGEEVFRSGIQQKQIAIFPAKSSEVGDLTIDDDGDEITVYIGRITHGHFNAFDLPDKPAFEQIAVQVADFVADLLAERVILWKSHDGSSGGWRCLNDDEIPATRRGARTFTWSGPL